MEEKELVNKVSWFNISGKIILFLIWSFFTFQLLSSSQPWTLLDGVNLLIHEAGHFLFAFAGQFLNVAGGSFFQIFVPSAITCYFLIRKQYFSSAAILFWIGDSLINVSVYIKDARAMVLPLLGGDIHDWNWLLTETNLLRQDQLIGSIVYFLGVIFIFASLFIMGLIIFHDIIIKLGKDNVVNYN